MSKKFNENLDNLSLDNVDWDDMSLDEVDWDEVSLEGDGWDEIEKLFDEPISWDWSSTEAAMKPKQSQETIYKSGVGGQNKKNDADNLHVSNKMLTFAHGKAR